MSELYKNIETLCIRNKTNITVMCKESGASRGALSDLKVGRTQKLSTDTLTKIADYFGVSVDYLLGKENTKKAPAKQEPDDEDIKFALFGGADNITDEMYEEVKAFAKFVEEREKKKRK